MNRRLMQVLLVGLLGVLALGVAACGGLATAAPIAQGGAPGSKNVPVEQGIPLSASNAPAAQGGTPVAANTAPTTDIGVSGTGTVFADPDTAITSLGVESTAPTLAAASQDASSRMTAVLAKIKSLGVDAKDVKTVSYNVNPIQTGYKEGEVPRITGYNVTNVVQIKIRKLSDVGTILDAAIAAGANSMNGLTYTIDDPSQITQQARAKAVADAMAKAQTLADAAKVKLGPMISITENVSTPRPVVMARSASVPMAADAAVGAGPVESGQNEVTVTVEMHWQIAQ